MRILFLRSAAIALAAGIGLGGCATYSPYGYGSGVSVSLGSGYDPYYNRYSSRYSPYGYGYASPYWGWYDGFYYPGSGYYVYDSYRRPYYWSDAQRIYWIKRRPSSGSTTSTSGKLLQNWADFANGGGTAATQSATTQSVRSTLPGRERTVRVERRASRERDEARIARAERRERVRADSTQSSQSDETSTRRRRGSRDD